MGNSASVQKLIYLEPQSSVDTIVTKFRDAHGLLITHTVKAGKDYRYITVNTALTNEAAVPVKLEYVQSFSLGMISPFQREAGANQCKIHRYRSCWSAEGRSEVRTAEELGLEASWQGAGVRALRFGQRSSMTIKEFFPYVAIEDTAQQVFGGAQLAAVGPWELEVSRYGDFLNLSGGHIDREMVGGGRKIWRGRHICRR